MVKFTKKFTGALYIAILSVSAASLPAHATPAVQTWSPSMSLSGSVLSVNLPTWSGHIGGSEEIRIWACTSQPTTLESLTSVITNPGVTGFVAGGCRYLSASNTTLAHPLNGLTGPQTVDLTTLYYLNPPSTYESYASRAGSIAYLVVWSKAEDNNDQYEVWSSIAHSGVSSSSSSEDEVPPPVYFGGPLLQGSTLPHFTQGEEGTVTLTGKRLNKITSATINGVAVTVSADRRSATITVPATLAAGTYDLVLQTTNGRLTVMRFIKVS